MAGNKQGRGESNRAEGLNIACERAWEDAKNNGAQPGDTLTIQKMQITGNNPITTYIVIVGPGN
jgi:hypothetical protein